MGKRKLIEGLPVNIPELDQPCAICLLTKATKNPCGPSIDVSTFVPGFILQLDFAFFNVASI